LIEILLFTVKVPLHRPKRKVRRHEGGTMLALHRKERVWTTAAPMVIKQMEMMMRRRTLKTW